MLLGGSWLRPRLSGLLGHLLRDTAGNTLMLVASALLPLLAMIGGGVDMSRGYLSQSRLQQACDSGVLAARKRLGTEAAVTGAIPAEAGRAGQRFFNLNFSEGAYGTRDRKFEMVLESDYSISGRATVNVPTSLMYIFGHTNMAVAVECEAQLDMTNTDVMMVLDVTGSMNQSNPGDTMPKIEVLKSTVRDFYDQLSAAAPPATRLRFGFVPYSSNVNVGHLLSDDWVKTTWNYQGRELKKPATGPDDLAQWRYYEREYDMRKWRTMTAGCIEERKTYEINDYGHVDLARALDLDIDLVPTANPETRWAPMYPEVVYARSVKEDGTGGDFTKGQKVTTDLFVSPFLVKLAACPAAARKLAPITRDQLTTYLATLVPTGPTYHDIGLIWGARLLSPTGLFASENANTARARPSSRNLIFLTDGETAPQALAYSAYGLEPIDQRRWKPGSPFDLAKTVENRFAFVCNEVKNKNIAVWVIGFGTAPNPVLADCAGPGRYFVAADAAQLSETFTAIARQMGDLRVTR